MRRIILISIIGLFGIPFLVLAVPGTCSSHNGINCDAGSDWDGSAICNDGWRDSSETYTSAIMCRDMLCTTLEYSDLKLKYNIVELERNISKIDSEMALLNANYLKEYYAEENRPQTMNSLIGAQNRITRNYQFELSSLESNRNLAVSSYNIAVGNLNSECATLGRDRYNRYADEAAIKYSNYVKGLLAEYKEEPIKQKNEPTTQNPQQVCPENSYYNGAKLTCSCNEDYYVSSGKCVHGSQLCEIKYGQESSYDSTANKCNYCKEGYKWNPDKTDCIELKGQVLGVNIDKSLSNKLKGQILLQVESRGEAYYVYPNDGKRYYMKDGAIAYEMMRSFGLGITNNDLSKIPSVNDATQMNNSSTVCSSNSLANSVKGKILLQVQSHGEAWYVHPTKCRRIYMKDGNAAYTIMRFLSLGITNKDLEKIEAGAM